MSTLYSLTFATSAQNTTSEIAYSTGGVPYGVTDGYQLPGGFLVPGMVIELSAYGSWTDAAIPGTLQHRLRVSDGITSTVLADTGANVATAIAGTQYWESRFHMLCQTAGASGGLTGQGIVIHGLTATTGQIWPINGLSGTFDTTSILYLELTTQWGTANANNVFQWNAYFINIRAQPAN